MASCDRAGSTGGQQREKNSNWTEFRTCVGDGGTTQSCQSRRPVREHSPTVVIVGGGFGGLAAAKALRKTPAEVVLIDRNNHHLFQPLLYQVATAVLGPGQIGSPSRAILRNQKNTTVILGEVTGVDKAQKCVFVSDADRQDVPVAYDYLILATGASHSYFGHDEYEKFAGVEKLGGCGRSPEQGPLCLRAG